MADDTDRRRATWDGLTLATIWFQGRRLPPWAIILDVTTTNRLPKRLKSIDPDGETAVWWWHFVFCVGCPRRERGAAVLGHVAALQEELRRLRDSFLKLIPRNFRAQPQRPPAREVYDDWVASLGIMAEQAAKADQCEWYGGYEPPGPYWSDVSLAPPWPLWVVRNREQRRG